MGARNQQTGADATWSHHPLISKSLIIRNLLVPPLFTPDSEGMAIQIHVPETNSIAIVYRLPEIPTDSKASAGHCFFPLWLLLSEDTKTQKAVTEASVAAISSCEAVSPSIHPSIRSPARPSSRPTERRTNLTPAEKL